MEADADAVLEREADPTVHLGAYGPWTGQPSSVRGLAMEEMLSQDGEGGEKKKRARGRNECLLEQARWPPTGLQFPFEVIWYLDSCQALFTHPGVQNYL